MCMAVIKRLDNAEILETATQIIRSAQKSIKATMLAKEEIRNPLPKASLNVPGVYYPILKALALEGISFVEVLSVNTEFGILFEDKDVNRAFSTIKKLTS